MYCIMYFNFYFWKFYLIFFISSVSLVFFSFFFFFKEKEQTGGDYTILSFFSSVEILFYMFHKLPIVFFKNLFFYITRSIHSLRNEALNKEA